MSRFEVFVPGDVDCEGLRWLGQLARLLTMLSKASFTRFCSVFAMSAIFFCLDCFGMEDDDGDDDATLGLTDELEELIKSP